ncbi:MAG: MBL fold metallo-hydrolase [Candidatus Diapherotrites archaeon]|nr:MBL fold metallo-hydrolase [Candidatus Diapherotrites archaeon]
MVEIIQLSVGGFDKNFSYIVFADKKSREAIIIDPTGDKTIIENALKKYKLILVMQLFTHNHSDHTELREYFSSKKIPTYLITPKSIGKKEILNFAGIKVTVLHTPGHTQESVCFIIEKNIFTGDTLFVKGIGTTAYGGDDGILEKSLNFLCTLDKNITLWPGHNYGGVFSTLDDALKNSHIMPSEKVLKIIKKKVQDYKEKQSRNQRKVSK